MGTSLGIGIGLGLGARRRVVTPKSIAGSKLALWIRADRGVTGSSNVSTWADQSGNGRDFTQATLSKRPDFTASGIGGRPSLSFNGTSDILDGPSFASIAGAGSAEVFAVFQLTQDPPTAEKGYGALWQMGSPQFDEEYVPYTDGKIYCGAFSTSRKSTNVSMGAGYFASPRILSVRSAAGDWRLSTDGVERYTTATNTFSTGGPPAIGGDPEGALGRFYGMFAEVVVCAPVLSGPERAAMLAYLGGRYGIAVP